MDLTEGTTQEKNVRSRKMMLWFAIVSMAMMFAGLTSAYVVSKNRPDWLTEFQLPDYFLWSTIAIVISSFSFHFSKKMILKNEHKKATGLLVLTLVLGLIFVFLQFKGFRAIVEQGYYFTGGESTVTTSFLYLFVLAHMVHILGGLITLLVVIYNHFKQRYKPGQMLGIELGATFWHFLDILWLYLFFFLYFFR